MKRLKPFFCYYGGKWRAVPRYPAPLHDLIVEPFAGAAGYATTYADRKVLLIERDPEIAALWRFLVAASPSEIRSIPLLTADQTTDDLVGAPEEARSLVGFWLNKGSSAPRRRPSTWFKSGTRPNSYWGEVVRERLAHQVDDIKHWRIQEGSYEDAPNERATWFVDPPYEKMGRFYRCSEVDYSHLADWVRVRRGQAIVCEQEGAGWLPFRTLGTIQASRGRGRKVSREVIWTGGADA